ncbi:hypothetical protein SAMN04488104_102710 [Algoriphagus faecimaris]|uniref:Uncharacterized protein n=1 Tax=Algoriphagus faecimaris TaxID=686796 RepID=A0A1G6U8M7_9BACT|nr:hypothetical protein SAMN04488104_102710 [Algoriphagus faecimaris]
MNSPVWSSEIRAVECGVRLIKSDMVGSDPKWVEFDIKQKQEN